MSHASFIQSSLIERHFAMTVLLISILEKDWAIDTKVRESRGHLRRRCRRGRRRDVAPARDSALSPTDEQVSFFRRLARCLGNRGERESCLPIRTEWIHSFRSPILSSSEKICLFIVCVFEAVKLLFSLLHPKFKLFNAEYLNPWYLIVASNVNTRRDTHV